MAQPVSMYLPTEPEGIESLIELTLDLRGTWEHAADELWGQLDPELWTLTLNAWAVLQTVSRAKLQVETAAEQHVFQLPVYVGELDPDAVQVELYADPVDGGAPLRQGMTRGAPLAGATNGYTFCAHVPASRPVTEYTPRLIPHHPEAAVPLEAAQILWQR